MYNDNQTSTKGARTDWEDLKMKVHVFDTYVTIKDREGHPDMDAQGYGCCAEHL